MFSSYDIAQHFGDIRIKPPSPKIRSSIWNAPELSLLKVNVDGSSKGNPRPSGADKVIRNHAKEFVGCFSEALGIRWACEADVIAILKALQFYKEHVLRHLVIECDSTLAVGVTNKS